MNDSNRRDISFFAVNEPYELYYRKDMTNHPVGAHTHNVAELYLTLTELPDALLNDGVSRIRRGTLIIIPPFCVHQLYHVPAKEYERYIFNVDVGWLENVLQQNTRRIEYLKHADKPLILPLNERQLVELTEAFGSFIPLAKERSIASLAAFFEVLKGIDDMVSQMQGEEAFDEKIIVGTQRKVNDIIAYINENISSEMSVEKVAEAFFLNKDYISRLFVKHTHTSIGRYISILRITKSQDLLREGKTVAQVQELMGYSSYAHFFKTFQKMTGISPSRYRSNYLGKEE